MRAPLRTFIVKRLGQPLLRAWLRFWVKPKLIQAQPEAIHPETETWYLLAERSLTEPLILQQICQHQDLPPASAQQLLFLQARAPRRFRYLGTQPTQDLALFWQNLAHSPERPVQVVPVIFFWGRAPGRETSLTQLLAADSWGSFNRFRRFLAVLVHGRQLWVEMGAPVLPQQLVSPEELQQRGALRAATKSQRLFHLYTKRVRTRVLGPDLSSRRTLRASLMASPKIKHLLKAGEHLDATPEHILCYLKEIASNTSYPALLFLERLLARLWNQLYSGISVTGLEPLREQAGRYTLVYLPCHRSHIDYLLLSFLLFQQGLRPPQIAAGINLNMPIIGPLLRRGGAFFMRRSFRNQPVYARVFSEYLYQLYNQGHPTEFFIEGGRSRTGRLLAPRPGLLSMTLEAAHRGTHKPLLLVPVYFGYEKVLEGRTFVKELSGQPKKKETPLDLVRVLRQLRRPHGQVSVSFGQPLALEGQTLHNLSQQPLEEQVQQVSQEIAVAINQAAILNRVNLLALAIPAEPNASLEEADLVAQLHLLSTLAQESGVANQPQGQPEDWIQATLDLGFMDCVEQPSGRVYQCSEQQSQLLAWYRNNVLHLFALPSLVACLFTTSTSLSDQQIHQQVEALYPSLAAELFLPRSFDAHQVSSVLERLACLGLLERAEGGGWQRPAEQPKAIQQLKGLAQLVQPSLEGSEPLSE